MIPRNEDVVKTILKYLQFVIVVVSYYVSFAYAYRRKAN